MTPEQRSKNASNARTARERTLLREVARLGELLADRNERTDAAIDEVAVLQRKNADLTNESQRYLSLADAWREEAQLLQEQMVRERAKRRRNEKAELPF